MLPELPMMRLPFTCIYIIPHISPELMKKHLTMRNTCPRTPSPAPSPYLRSKRFRTLYVLLT
jgi:hypothetical protein